MKYIINNLMKETGMKKRCLIVLVGLIFPYLLHATDATQEEKTIVKIDGSSTVAPISEAVAEDFQNAKHIRVTVGTSGTGGGFKKFCKGEIDIADASRPILKSEKKEKNEMEICKKNKISYIELPVAYDALTVVVNPKNTWVKSLTVAELKKIWQPTPKGAKPITHWNQINKTWPKKPIKLYGAGTDSGTFDYFTEAIVGKATSSRTDYTATENDNVTVSGVANDPYALGYFGFSYYKENTRTLKAVAIGSLKKAVMPSEETVKNGTYQPLSRPLFIYVNVESLKKPAVKEFVEYYLKNAPKLVKEANYMPLAPSAYASAEKRFNENQIGTVFAGQSEVGLTIEEILGRKPKV